MKVTIAFSDDELYRRVRVHAAATGRQIRDIVEEAVAAWLEQAEEDADMAASADALAEYETVGGTEADAFFAHMISEGRVSYETD